MQRLLLLELELDGLGKRVKSRRRAMDALAPSSIWLSTCSLRDSNKSICTSRSASRLLIYHNVFTSI